MFHLVLLQHPDKQNLLQNYENKTKWTIKTEHYADTEADVLEIPLSNSSFLYELPDLSNETSVLARVEKETQRVITPKKQVKMTRFIIGDGTTIMVGGLAMLSVLQGHHTSYQALQYSFLSLHHHSVQLQMSDIAARSKPPIS